MKNDRKDKILWLSQMAVLTAIVIIMAFTPLGYLRIGPPYTSDPPLFSGQARPRPHVLPAFTLRPENGPIIRLTVPAVNAGRQKTSAGTVSPPFRPAPDLTEAPLSDFAVSLRSLENAAYPSYPYDRRHDRRPY